MSWRKLWGGGAFVELKKERRWREWEESEESGLGGRLPSERDCYF